MPGHPLRAAGGWRADLTSVVDQRGTLRAQYVGVRSDPDELLRDLRSLRAEGTGR